MVKSLLSILLLANACLMNLHAEYSIKLKISDFPKGRKDIVQLLSFYGDDFKIIDSTGWLNTDTTLIFTIKNAHTGLYALKFRSERHNQAELLLNIQEKDIELKANFDQLMNGEIEIVNSKENTAYSSLIALRIKYEPQFYQADNLLGNLSVYQADYKNRLLQYELDAERLYSQFNIDLNQLAVNHPNTYTADILVPLAKIPERKSKVEWEKTFDGHRSFLHKHFFDEVNTADTRILYHYAFIDKIKEYLAGYTDKNTDGSKDGIDIVMSALKENYDVNTVVFNSLLKVFIKHKTDALIKHLMEKHPSGCSLNLSPEELIKVTAITSTAIGSKAPDILLYDNNNKAQSLYEYCKKNKITVLAFWVSWCVRCKKEMPETERIYQQYKKSGLGLFAVSLDEQKTDWQNAIAENKLSGINVSELLPIKQSKIPPTFNLSTTPAVYVLDKESKILAKNIFGKELEDFLKTKIK